MSLKERIRKCKEEGQCDDVLAGAVLLDEGLEKLQETLVNNVSKGLQKVSDALKESAGNIIESNEVASKSANRAARALNCLTGALVFVGIIQIIVLCLA